MTITLLLIILILLLWNIAMMVYEKQLEQMYKDRIDRNMEWAKGWVDKYRKSDMKVLELQSELEEAERKMNLLRQMNEKLRSAQ